MKTKSSTFLTPALIAGAVVIAAAAQAGQGPQPSICSRSCWGARAPTCGISQMGGLTRAIIHHTAGAGDYSSDLASSKAIMRGVQNLHINNGWCDIAYHFLVNAAGQIFEGRSGSMSSLPRGTHDGNNSNSFGFTMLGYFHPPYNHNPNGIMRSKLYDVIAWRMPSAWSAYGSGTYNGNNVGFLDGHRKVKATACPGDGMYNPFITDNRNGGEARTGVMNRKNGLIESAHVPGDFVEDGKTDCSLWNPSNGQWNIRSSINGDVYTFSYGLPGDIPVIGHISSESRAEAGIFRPSTGTWFWRHGVTGNTIGSYVWGQSGDIPLVGAWSGRLWDAVVFRNGTWYVRFGDTGNTANFAWGQAGDIPKVGDILGNGMVDQAVFRPSTGMWYWRNGETGQTIGSYTWGQNGDIPMVGAWSGRMRDAAVFRPSTGRWYIRFGHTGETTNFEFGQNGDTPMVGNFFGNGVKDQAVYRRSTGQWWIRNGVTGAVASFVFGSSAHMAVSE